MNVELALWASAALAGGPFLFVRGLGSLRLKRLMENTPTARIRSMAMGLVEVHGTVEAKSATRAPFSGHPCAYWEVDIATRARRSGWTVFHRHRSGQPFYLRDESGVALVYPKGATCSVRHEKSEECLGVALPDVYADYMREHGVSLFRLGALRFRERVLEEGMPLYVLGTATPRSIAHVVSMDGELAATGSDGPGDAWHRARQEQVVGVIRQGEHERTFVLSQDSERALHVTLGLRALGMLVGGPLLTVVGLSYWLFTLGGNR